MKKPTVRFIEIKRSSWGKETTIELLRERYDILDRPVPKRKEGVLIGGKTYLVKTILHSFDTNEIIISIAGTSES